jgi:hypothetical protein
MYIIILSMIFMFIKRNDIFKGKCFMKSWGWEEKLDLWKCHDVAHERKNNVMIW